MQKLSQFFKSHFFKDARHFQIMTLGTLLSLLLLWSDFAPPLEVVALTLSSTIITQFLFFKFLKILSTPGIGGPEFSSSFISVPLGKLHYRALERNKIEALKLSKGNFDRYTSITLRPISTQDNFVAYRKVFG